MKGINGSNRHTIYEIQVSLINIAVYKLQINDIKYVVLTFNKVIII